MIKECRSISNQTLKRLISSDTSSLLNLEAGSVGYDRIPTGIQLEFLGTSSAVSTNTRNVSSLAFNFGGGTFLFDCGEGTVRQFLRTSVRPSTIQSVFITHLHGDHFYGLPGLGMRTLDLKYSGKCIRVVSPKGIRTIFGHSLLHYRQFDLHEISPSLRSPISREEASKTIHWSHKDRSFFCYDHPLFTVHAAPIRHSVFCVGYVIKEKQKRGNIDAEKLFRDHGIKPGPLFKDIISKPSITLPNGKIIRGSDYMSPPRRPRKIVILGDTCDPTGIAHLAMDADVLVHEATCSNQERNVALENGHSTAGMAGAFARSIRAKNLILTHFSPRNFHSSEFEECAHMQTLIQQAKNEFNSPNVFAASAIKYSFKTM